MALAWEQTLFTAPSRWLALSVFHVLLIKRLLRPLAED